MLLKSRQAGQKIITSQAYRLLDEATGLGNRKAKALIGQQSHDASPTYSNIVYCHF